jgi:hypothetical protein
VKKFNVQELQELMKDTEGPAISIFLPTHEVSPPQDRQDQISLKNALSRAELLLQEHDLDGKMSSQILQPAYDLLEDALFWQYQKQGLAIFLSPSVQRIYRLPVAFQPQVVVNSHFQITPLLSFFDKAQTFYVLSLSLNEVKLFEADRNAMKEVPVADMPASLQDLLKYDVFEKQLQFHSQSGGGNTPTYHGHGEEGYTKKEQIHAYSQAINKGLHDMLNGSKAPLVVAAVDYVFAIFKSHCDYSELLEKPILGSPEHINVSELHKAAFAQVEEIFTQQKEAAIESIKAQEHTGRVLHNTRAIVDAARQNRVEKLLFGTIPEVTELVTQRGSDPLNTAAIETLRHGGEVLALDSPHRVSAVLRY